MECWTSCNHIWTGKWTADTGIGVLTCGTQICPKYEPKLSHIGLKSALDLI